MQNQGERHESPWGAKVNSGWQHSTRDCPAWARPLQREKWGEQGVVIWDHEAQEITRLTATQALRILDQLRASTDWKQHGIIVGEPATEIWLDNPDKKPQDVLINQIHLDATQVQGLLDLLLDNEEILQRMSEAEEEECRRRLAAVYDILLKCGRRRRERKQNQS